MSEWNWSAERRTAIGDVANQPLEYAAERLLESRKRAFEAEHKAHALQTELDALKAAHAWIKTSERMPDAADGSCCDVLAIIDGTAIVLNYTPDDSVHPWADEFSNIYRADEVSHWQPLPEPPKMSTWTKDRPTLGEWWLSVAPNNRTPRLGVQWPPVLRCLIVDAGNLLCAQFGRALFRLDLDIFVGAQWKRVDPDPADPFAEQPRGNSRDSDLP